MSYQWISVEERLPECACWCIAAYLSNDDPPGYYVHELWYNPSAIHKWWIGSVGDSKELRQPVTHWMPLPDAPPLAQLPQ